MAASTRIVGRADDVAAVRDLVDALPVGGVLVLEGEAGIGKSSLLDVACARADAAGAAVVRASADEFSRSRPLGLLPADLHPGDTADVDHLLAALERRAGGRSLVLALDDLQWADAASLGLLAPLVRRLVPSGAAVLLAHRPWPRPPELNHVLDRLEALRPRLVRLDPLSSPEAHVLAQYQLGEVLAPDLAKVIDRAGGNPFYVLALLDALRADGRLVARGDVVGVTEGEIAGSLQRLVLQRVRLLGDDAVRVLRTAAVLGRSFSLELLEQLAGSTAGVRRAVADAVTADVLAVEGQRFGFRHDLVREALEHDLPAPLRRSLHRDAVDALTAVGAGADDIVPHLLRAALRPDDADLVLRLTNGCTPAAALELLDQVAAMLTEDDPRTADVAVARVDALLWAGHAEEAVAAGRALLAPDAPLRPSGTQADQVHGSIAHALFVLGRPGEAVDTWPWFPDHVEAARRAAELGEVSFASLFAGRLAQATELAERARTLSDDPTSAALVSMVLAWTRFAAGDLERALTEADHAVELAGHAGEGARRIGPLLVRAMVRDALGDTAGALADVAADHANATDRAAAVRVPFRHLLAASALQRAGRWDDAQAELDAGTTSSADLGVGAVHGWLTAIGALMAFGRSGPDEAKRRLAAAPSAQLGADNLLWVTALVAASEGDLATALSLLGLVADVTAALGSRTSLALVGPDLVRTALACDDAGRVTSTLELLDWAATSPSPAQRGAHRWAHGLARRDPVTVATAAVELEVCRPIEAARARHHASVLAAAAGDSTLARSLAQASIAAFDLAGAAHFADSVRADLQVAGVRLRTSRPTAARVGWDAVTTTERDVLALLADGLSNATIAERLYMSRRTVESHLAHVYAKVGIGSRIELVRHLVARGATHAG